LMHWVPFTRFFVRTNGLKIPWLSWKLWCLWWTMFQSHRQWRLPQLTNVFFSKCNAKNHKQGNNCNNCNNCNNDTAACHWCDKNGHIASKCFLRKTGVPERHDPHREGQVSVKSHCVCDLKISSQWTGQHMVESSRPKMSTFASCHNFVSHRIFLCWFASAFCAAKELGQVSKLLGFVIVWHTLWIKNCCMMSCASMQPQWAQFWIEDCPKSHEQQGQQWVKNELMTPQLAATQKTLLCSFVFQKCVCQSCKKDWFSSMTCPLSFVQLATQSCEQTDGNCWMIKETCSVAKTVQFVRNHKHCCAASCVVDDLSAVFHAVDPAAHQATHRCTPAHHGMLTALLTETNLVEFNKWHFWVHWMSTGHDNNVCEKESKDFEHRGTCCLLSPKSC